MKHRYERIYKKFKSADPNMQLQMLTVLSKELDNLEELLSKMSNDLVGCGKDD